MTNCLNFRDVGEWLKLFEGRPRVPPGRLLRGGELDLVSTPEEIGLPGTIINLRMGPDRADFGSVSLHVAIPNAIEK